MPDILIWGMEMPHEPTAITIFPNGDVYDFFADDKLGVAKELPPHGDLILKDDAIAVVKIVSDLYPQYRKVLAIVWDQIKDLPVVVPAERREG